MTPRPSAVAALALAASLFLLAGACTGSRGRKLIPPPPTTVGLDTTAPPGSDFTGVGLEAVAGRAPVEPVEIIGGNAIMAGRISGPDGPVAGATVRLERFVGDAMGRLDVVSNADGTWRAPQVTAPTTVPTTTAPLLPGQVPTVPPRTAPPPPPPVINPAGPQGLLGGRYRVRAWRTPDLALTTPQILFLEGEQDRQLGLQLSRYRGTTVSSVSSPDPPIVAAPLSVTAVVTSAAVDRDGVVRSVPLPNAGVSLSVGGNLAFVGGATATNGQGRATFQLRCEAVGPSSLQLTVNGAQSFTLPVRPCVQPAPTTTTSLPLDPGASTTSVSIPGGGPPTPPG